VTLQLLSRRHALALAAASATLAIFLPRTARAQAKHPDSKWYAKAKEMRELAESWGDQSYGAVVVLGGKTVGLGPSRVVKDQDSDAHAERVAIREAQRELGTQSLTGSVLYSTSRPCPLCEATAARAGVSRMYYGPLLTDAGSPKLQGQ
jgi:tRNA(adenine34) deaminase